MTYAKKFIEFVLKLVTFAKNLTITRNIQMLRIYLKKYNFEIDIIFFFASIIFVIQLRAHNVCSTQTGCAILSLKIR